MALCARSRPCDSRTRGKEKRSAERHLVADAQRRAWPVGPTAAQVGPVDKIGYPNHTPDAVVRHSFEMVDEILTREVLLRHRPIEIMLIADMTVNIDLRRYDGLSRKIHAHCVCGNLNLAAPACPGELRAFHDEGGVFKHRSVADNQSRPLEDGGARGLLSVHQAHVHG